ncbi:MAG: hypothetical protein ACUVTQ_12290 [Desulfotomaculales bacterium]
MAQVRIDAQEFEVRNGAELEETIKRAARSRGTDAFMVRVNERFVAPGELRSARLEGEVYEIHIIRYFRAG